ncbi:hypothetical protein DFH08DRAFT_222816 [Mycena albidolilacea]|uniref:Uncharacterized protein n=1 Tax=Mycena albidolilacea TaxID=1033008 RepID=A0AAD6ZX41_9AGAR|nr:hypothetical protein DFH08DRAFT_222816 [Mycena albidolilacea]
MEAAGHDDRPPKSNWAAAMARASELDTKTNNRHERHDKENREPPSRTEPPRGRDRSGIHEKSDRLQPNPTTKEPLPRGPKRKSRWDVCVKDSLRESRASEHQRSVASSATIREGNALRLWETNASVPAAPSCLPNPVSRPATRLPASQTRHEPIPSAPITSRLEEASERAALEPLHNVNTPAAASLALPLLDRCASTEVGCYDGARAGTCLPMEMSPASPTRFIPLPSCGNGQDAPPDLPTKRAGSPVPLILSPPVMECESIAFCGGSGIVGRRRSDSLSSTASSMVISACSSPTRFIFEKETPSVPSEKPVLCSPPHRGLVGGSEPSSEAHQGCSPTTPSASAPAGTESENVVAHKSTFWPGQTLAFKCRQGRKPLRPIV